MVGTLTTVYSVLILLIALGGTAFVLANPIDGDDETTWARWGNVAAVAIFLVALVAAILVA